MKQSIECTLYNSMRKIKLLLSCRTNTRTLQTTQNFKNCNQSTATPVYGRCCNNLCRLRWQQFFIKHFFHMSFKICHKIFLYKLMLTHLQSVFLLLICSTFLMYKVPFCNCFPTRCFYVNVILFRIMILEKLLLWCFINY